MNLGPRFLMLYVLPFAAVLLAGSARAAEFVLTPSITISEEFNDNIAEDKQRTLGSEFITRAIPGLAVHYAAPFWVWDGIYSDEYRYYDLNKRKSENLPNLSTKTKLTLIDQKAFIRSE